MISSKLSRVAQRAPSAAVISNTSCTASHRTSQSIAGRRSHQRRHSSSKASCPPDSSPSGGKPAPATKTSATSSNAASDKVPISDGIVQQRGGKRVSRSKRARTIAVSPEDHFAGLPSVPATQHLHPTDVSVSSFFSLHRPLSITSAFPPTSTSEAFDSIFETRQQPNPWENGNSAERRPEDVIYTLHNTLESLESGANGNADDVVRWEVIHESPSNQDGIKHLDGAPQLKSLDELVAQFKPFRAPPPPQAFVDEPNASSSQKRASKESQLSRHAHSRAGQQLEQQARRKSYTTTIIVTESTAADGQRTYTASSSPIVRIPDPDDAASIGEPRSGQTPARFPFRERMRLRQQEYMARQMEKMQSPAASRPYVRRAPVAKRPKMLLISVKRQRKLKMKKHKYKKLMRRTRNLRRRQDRA